MEDGGIGPPCRNFRKVVVVVVVVVCLLTYVLTNPGTWKMGVLTHPVETLEK